jgi:hypothetical protein
MQRRVQGIKSAMNILYDLIAKYTGSYSHCNSTKSTVGSNPAERRQHCDTLVLGSMTRGAIARGLWPRIYQPNERSTFVEVVAQIRTIRIVSGCPGHDAFNWSPHHGIAVGLDESLRCLETTFGAPDLNFWLGKRNKAAQD